MNRVLYWLLYVLLLVPMLCIECGKRIVERLFKKEGGNEDDHRGADIRPGASH